MLLIYIHVVRDSQCASIWFELVFCFSDNDGLIGSINDLDNDISLTKRKKDARGSMGAQAKVLSNHVKVRGEAFRGKTSQNAKCTFETSELKRDHAWIWFLYYVPWVALLWVQFEIRNICKSGVPL